MYLVRIGSRVVNLDRVGDMDFDPEAFDEGMRKRPRLRIFFSCAGDPDYNNDKLEFWDDRAVQGWAMINGLVQASACTTNP